jgi:hypothetical protein
VFQNQLTFKRTLCGGPWELFKSDNYLVPMDLPHGGQTGRLGCCPPGKFMTDNMADPFVAADHCASCEIGFFTDGDIHDLSCRTCPKGYEIIGTHTTKCYICSFSKVSFFLFCFVRTVVVF